MGVRSRRGFEAFGWAFLTLAMLSVSCGAPGAREAGTGPADQPRTGPKRMIAVMRGDPGVISSTVDGANVGRTPGSNQLERLLNAGLAGLDDKSVLRPLLAVDVPSLENGLWKVYPDGTMETTWRINPASTWHDGVPFTSQDVLFSLRLSREKEIAIFRDPAYDSIASAEAPDAHTAVLRWSKPFIEADSLLSAWRALPVPQHLLIRTYEDSREGFLQARYWSEDFVGTGPFRLKEWFRGSHLILEANERFVLGRPKIDEIEVKIIPDPDTIVANILTGGVDITLGQTVSSIQALELRARWDGGALDSGTPTSWIGVWPQMLTPSPALVGDVRFRRALLQAIDRQEIVDTLLPGLTQVAHGRLPPGTAEYDAVAGSLVRYEYSLAAAARGIEELGYRRGPDGLLRDAAGQTLSVEIRSTGGRDDQVKSMLAVADYWQRAGVETTPLVTPPQRASDREYRATFPGFEVVNQGTQTDSLRDFVRSEIATPENRFTGRNRSRYDSAELDSLIERFYTTVPKAERMEVLRRAVVHLSEQVVPLGIFYNVSPAIISARTRNVTGASLERDSAAWDAHNWDLK